MVLICPSVPVRVTVAVPLPVTAAPPANASVSVPCPTASVVVSVPEPASAIAYRQPTNGKIGILGNRLGARNLVHGRVVTAVMLIWAATLEERSPPPVLPLS